MNVLAQVSGEFILEGFQKHTSQTALIPYFLAVLGIVAVGITVWAIVANVRTRRKPLALFYELAQIHGLDRRSRRRLLHLARSHKVAEPASLFVCPDLVRQVESLELMEAHSQRARRRAEAFFSQFTAAAFGEPRREA